MLVNHAIIFMYHDGIPTAVQAPKKRTYQTQEQVKVGYRLCQNPAYKPCNRADGNPATDRFEAVLVRNVGTRPHPEVNIFAGHRSVDDTSHDDCRKRNAESDFGYERACRAERWTSNEWACVVVYHHGDDHVKGHCDALFEKECLFEVAGVFEFGLEGEEGDMAS
jgi:hypothetical protein